MRFIICIGVLGLIVLAGLIALQYQANAPAMAAAQATTELADALQALADAQKALAAAYEAYASIPKTLAWVGLLLVVSVLLSGLALIVILIRFLMWTVARPVTVHFLPPGEYSGLALPERTNRDDYLDSGLQFGWLRGQMRRPVLRGREPRV